jgi:hypothetical protein
MKLENAMKALIIYVVFVAIGAVISALVGLFVEREMSSALGLFVGLTLFFLNFVISWLATILVMDGTLRNAQAGQDQVDIEKAGQASMRAARAESDALRTASGRAKSA